MKRSTLVRAALPTTLALGLVLSGCSAANEPSGDGAPSSSDATTSAGSDAKLSGTLNGAGSSAQQAAFQAWAAGFNATNPDVTVNYDPSGSGAGRKQFLSGAVPMAGSDAYLSTDELAQAKTACKGGEALDLPVYVSPIAIAFNLDGVEDLTLSPKTVAGIFAQKIKDWSDPAITADNGGKALEAGAITVVNRSDDSGTTENFTEYLSANAPDVWTDEPSGTWPVAGGEGAQGTSGVVSAIKAGAGAIGYADESQVGDLSTAKVIVQGEGVGPTAEAAAKVVDISEPAPDRPTGDLAIDVNRTPDEAGVYPVVLVSYQIACTKYEKQSDADLVKAFIGYTSSQEGQEAAAAKAGSAPISAERSAEIKKSLDMITAG